MESLFLRDAQAVGRCNFWALNSAPFFQIVKLIAAIFRAKVRRAMVGRIPFSARATKKARRGPGRVLADTAALLKRFFRSRFLLSFRPRTVMRSRLRCSLPRTERYSPLSWVSTAKPL